MLILRTKVETDITKNCIERVKFGIRAHLQSLCGILVDSKPSTPLQGLQQLLVLDD
jgi:hypothetical protein